MRSVVRSALERIGRPGSCPYCLGPSGGFGCRAAEDPAGPVRSHRYQVKWRPVFVLPRTDNTAALYKHHELVCSPLTQINKCCYGECGVFSVGDLRSGCLLIGGAPTFKDALISVGVPRLYSVFPVCRVDCAVVQGLSLGRLSCQHFPGRDSKTGVWGGPSQRKYLQYFSLFCLFGVTKA